MYADDTQLYMEPRDRNNRIARINACIEDKNYGYVLTDYVLMKLKLKHS